MKLSSSAARVIALTSLAAAVLFAGCAAIGLEIASRDRMLPGVVVLGVSVGGLTLDEAAARLGPTSAAILDAPVQLELGQRTWKTTPRELGMKLDPGELAAGAFGVGHAGSLSTNLREQLGALWSETAVSVTSTGDGRALDELMKRIADETDAQPRDAHLELGDDGTLSYQTSLTGASLDRPASRDLVARALAEGRPSVTLVTRTLPPAVETALLDGRIDGVLHYSRRSAEAFIACVQRSGIQVLRLDLRHYCLSAQVASPLIDAGAASIRIAPLPRETSLIELVGPA